MPIANCIWFDPNGLEPTIPHIRDEQANHYITDAVIFVTKMRVRFTYHILWHGKFVCKGGILSCL